MTRSASHIVLLSCRSRSILTTLAHGSSCSISSRKVQRDGISRFTAHILFMIVFLRIGFSTCAKIFPVSIQVLRKLASCSEAAEALVSKFFTVPTSTRFMSRLFELVISTIHDGCDANRSKAPIFDQRGRISLESL